MSSLTKLFMTGVGMVGIFAAALWLSGDSSRVNTVSQPDQVQLAMKIDEQGPVSVSVTPPSILLGVGEWIFSTTLETHSWDLIEDIAAAASLVDDAGREYAAVRWDGDPPGGHHRQGALVFRPIVSSSKFIELRLRDMGGVALRRFSWEVQ